MILQLLVNLGIPAFLIILAFITGRSVERKHNQSLDQKEREFSGILVTDLKSFPGGNAPEPGGELVIGEVVIATDYLKSLLAGLRKILGGELRSYLGLMTRARREAIVRMVEKARAKGYNAVGNVRIEFANIGGVGINSRSHMIMVAILASGTAYRIAEGG